MTSIATSEATSEATNEVTSIASSIASNDSGVILSEQTRADLTVILEKLDQRIHEISCDKDAINATDPAEAATLYDLRDSVKDILS